jgi:hypothetical protein
MAHLLCCAVIWVIFCGLWGHVLLLRLPAREDVGPCAGAGVANLLDSEVVARGRGVAGATHHAFALQPERTAGRSRGGLSL